MAIIVCPFLPPFGPFPSLLRVSFLLPLLNLLNHARVPLSSCFVKGGASWSVHPSARARPPARARPFSSVTAVTRSNHGYWKSESDRQCCQIPRPPALPVSLADILPEQREREEFVKISSNGECRHRFRRAANDTITFCSPPPLRPLALPLAAPLPLPSLEGRSARASNRDEMAPFIPSRRRPSLVPPSVRLSSPSHLRVARPSDVHLQFCTDGTSARSSDDGTSKSRIANFNLASMLLLTKGAFSPWQNFAMRHGDINIAPLCGSPSCLASGWVCGSSVRFVCSWPPRAPLASC